MLKGNIIDVYPDNKKNVMVTWLTDKGKSIRIEDSYQPSLYVYSSREHLFNLASILRDIPEVKTLNFTEKKITLGSDKKKFLLEIFPKKIKSIRKIAETIDSWGGYTNYRLYNVDLRISSRYLQDKGVFCNAYVKWDGKQFITDEKQWDIDYQSSFYKTINLDIKSRQKNNIFSFEDPIKSIKIGKNTISEKNEIDTILLSIKTLKKINPDIIFTHKGDSVFLPYLYHRAKQNNIEKNVNLGRDDINNLKPVKQEKSYFSYGQIIYRPAFYTLHGRAHIDNYNSFIFSESGLRGLIDMSRCSNIPLQILSRVGPGTAISQIQLNKAREYGYLIPWKKNKPEDWKTAMQLLISDRGGLILDPCVGLHEDVIELDFASLYPNIMLRFNISPETMLCSCCRQYPSIVVPQLGYHICNKKHGLLPEVLKPIIYRRFCYKARSKNKEYNRELYRELQQAWKWVLLVCFGYTGYRNARYGRIECYESITAFSRDILLSAVETVEDAGYKVLHGIIDSLWVKAKKDCIKPFQLIRLISKKTGIKIDEEGHYKWIVFLPSKITKAGSLNRYYGLFDNGEIKVRGVEIRQKNSPVFLKNMQKEILNALGKAGNKEEFLKQIPAAVEIIKKYGLRIIHNNFELGNLLIKNSVSRDISEYKVNNLVKSALLQLRDEGVLPQPGQSVRYIVCDEKNRRYKKRVCIAENIKKDDKIDIDFYLRQIAQYSESLLIPFGFTLEKIYEMLEKIKYREVYNVSILPRVGTCQTSI